MKQYSRFYSLTDIARLTGKSKQWIYNEIQKGVLKKYSKVGNVVICEFDEVRRWAKVKGYALCPIK